MFGNVTMTMTVETTLMSLVTVTMLRANRDILNATEQADAFQKHGSVMETMTVERTMIQMNIFINVVSVFFLHCNL